MNDKTFKKIGNILLTIIFFGGLIGLFLVLLRIIFTYSGVIV